MTVKVSLKVDFAGGGGGSFNIFTLTYVYVHVYTRVLLYVCMCAHASHGECVGVKRASRVLEYKLT